MISLRKLEDKIDVLIVQGQNGVLAHSTKNGYSKKEKSIYYQLLFLVYLEVCFWMQLRSTLIADGSNSRASSETTMHQAPLMNVRSLRSYNEGVY